MIPWELLASSDIPGDGGEMRLYRRGDEYSIRVGAYELMNSRVHASEDALAEIACERLGKMPQTDVLIGGLGMGFTLAGVLRKTHGKSRVVVAELVPAVVEWNRTQLAQLNGALLDDPRVRVITADVGRVIRSAASAYDAILLDVDNGPAGLTSKKNDWLYGTAGVAASLAALRPGGVLAVWSAGPDAAFRRRLEQAGFMTEEVRVRARGGRGGARFVIWVARKNVRESHPSP